jgi:hypothetical protein
MIAPKDCAECGLEVRKCGSHHKVRLPSGMTLPICCRCWCRTDGSRAERPGVSRSRAMHQLGLSV